MKNIILVYIGFLFLAVIFTEISCSDTMGCTDSDAVNFDINASKDDGTCVYRGCTDPISDNYNPIANEDDGSCIYSKEKFLGPYRGSLVCDDVLGEHINNNNLGFYINETSGGMINDVVIKLFFPLTAAATVNGNNIIINSNSTIMDFADIDMDGIPEHFDIQLTGAGNISGDTITIILNFVLSNPLLSIPLTDQCTLVGVKV